MNTTTSLHLGYGEAEPKTRINTYPNAAPLGSVDLDGGAITICARNATDLFRVADEFARAAHELRQAVVEYEAQQILDRPEPIGGGACPCGDRSDFYTDEDRTRWDEQHAFCEQVTA